MTRYLSLITLLCITTMFIAPASPDIELYREGIQVTRDGNSLLVQLPFLQTDSQRLIDDLTVTLLEAESFQSLVKVRKKVVLLSGEKTEQVALPITGQTPALEDCVLRIDLSGHIWLKRFVSQEPGIDLHVIGQTEWLAGSRTAVRVLVSDTLTGKPLPDAEVRLEIFRETERAGVLAVGTSDASGSTDLTFRLRKDDVGDYTLRVSASSGDVTNRVESPIVIQNHRKVFLSTDKPVYQPGQLMHIRGLAVHAADGTPLPNTPLTLEVADGKGNKVFKQTGETSEFGIFSADFQLADEVNQGDYAIKAIMADSETEKNVQVYEYVLPKFSVAVKPERTFYKPGDTITGTIKSRYFFGKPLEEANVHITGNAFDVGFNAFAVTTGRTDSDGTYAFSLPIPQRLVGQPLFDGNTMIQLDVRVTDSADHEEQKTHYVHVSVNPVEIELIPESGALITGVENEIYVAASYPDGSAAQATVLIESPNLSQSINLTCDENGMATFAFTPEEQIEHAFTFTIHARVDGAASTHEITLSPGSNDDTILLRPDNALYRVGESMNLNVFSAAHDHERVFFDIVRNGQTVLTQTLAMHSGSATTSVALDAMMAGTLELHAYRVRGDGNIVRDVRRVVVLRADDLRIEIAPDQTQYQPGESATVQLAVTGARGEPVQSALGIHIVDESVYSLSEKEPGLMKVFFAIERQLLEPKVQIQGYALDQVITLSAAQLHNRPVMARALFAKLDDPASFSLTLNTASEKAAQVNTDLRALQGALLGLELNVSSQPTPVDELLLREDKPVVRYSTLDPWNRAYTLFGENREIWLGSLGPDGSHATEDDIRVPAFPQGFSFVNKANMEDPFVFFGQGNPQHRVFSNVLDDDGDGIRERMVFRRANVGRGQNVQLGMALGIDRMAVMEPAMREGVAAQPAPADDFNVQLRSLGYLGGGNTTRYDISLQDAAPVSERTYVEESSEPDPTGQWFYDPDAPQPSVVLPSGDFDGESVDLFTRFEELQNLNPGADEPMIIGDLASLQKAADAYLNEELSDEMTESLKALSEQIALLQAAQSTENERAVRVRRYFPETLFYTPELITDAQGRATLSLPGADSITTWRMSTTANAKSGALGDATAALQVFKPFFVDINLPVFLTQDDEVTLPVSVYNYLDTAQDVEVTLENPGWFSLLDGSLTQTLRVEANEVASVKYRIRANELGSQPLTVYAWGTDEADAIGRPIDVRPNGDPRFVNLNGRLDETIHESVVLPASRIENADRLFVKIYPGVFSQVLEGLDSILQMPHGCFEQTSSTSYPNLLTLRYMRDTDNITPAIEMKATEYINLGYQRLLTFEIEGGGFSVFGNPPANRVLSAYGLLQFSDMSRVYPVDERVLDRTRTWLLSQRNADGTWSPDENYSHAEMWQSIQNNPLLVTAYVAYALAASGETTSLQKTTRYLLDNANEATDAYTLAIVTNTLLKLAPSDPATRQSLQRLVEMGTISDEQMYWRSEASLSFARGEHAWVETTAWAALAIIESERYNTELDKALNWLIRMKDPQGTWGTTHGTVLALKALIRSLGSITEEMNGTITVSVDGAPVSEIQITSDTSDVMRQVDLTGHLSGNSASVELVVNQAPGSSGSLLYQVVGKYYVPWQEMGTLPDDFSIEVEYDRTQFSVNDTVVCNVTARNNRTERAEMIMVDVGVPPGFRVEQSALDAYVDAGIIEKYTIMSRQLLIYLESLDGETTLDLAIPMRATLPLIATVPESTMYEYYHPETKSVAEPSSIIVE